MNSGIRAFKHIKITMISRTKEAFNNRYQFRQAFNTVNQDFIKIKSDEKLKDLNESHIYLTYRFQLQAFNLTNVVRIKSYLK